MDLDARTSRAGRIALLVMLGLSVAGCETYGPNPSGEVYLPEATQRLSASAVRDAQLRTGTSRDDYPELTGAPDPDGKWPARTGPSSRTVYRDAEQLVVGSEGPWALTR